MFAMLLSLAWDRGFIPRSFLAKIDGLPYQEGKIGQIMLDIVREGKLLLQSTKHKLGSIY